MGEDYELVEINSRYSYMGNYIHFTQDFAAVCSVKYDANKAPIEVRNLLNRTRLSLGAPPLTLPSRDQVGLSKIAAMLYTDRKGPLSEIFNSEKLHALIKDNPLDGFGPKPVYIAGAVTDADLREYSGWAKIGCILLTMENN